MYNRRIVAQRDSSHDVRSRDGMLCYIVQTFGPTALAIGALTAHRVQTIDNVTPFNVMEDELTLECWGADCPGCAVCDPISKHPLDDHQYWVVERHTNKILRTPFASAIEAETHKNNLPNEVRQRTLVYRPNS